MPYEVGPVIEVVSVSVLSAFGRPRQSSRMVVFAGLPLRGRMGSWYRTREVEVELDPTAVTGYGVSCERIDRPVGECDNRGVGGRAACCRCICAASMSTEDVPAALLAALIFDN
jgi:hypothetical protein